MKVKNNLESIEKGLTLSGFENISIDKTKNNMYLIKFKRIVEYKLYAFVRTVGRSGWDHKPYIRRVQITGFNIDDISPTQKNEASIILGVERIFERDIFVVWNIYNFGAHKKNRSCYVSVSNLFKAFLTGYHTTTDTNQKIWISDSYHFDILLMDYIKFNNYSSSVSI